MELKGVKEWVQERVVLELKELRSGFRRQGVVKLKGVKEL